MADYSKAFEAANRKYQDIVEKTRTGAPVPAGDKAKAKLEVRNIERQAAREGVILSAENRGGGFVVSTQDAPSKRSLQEQYVRGFDDKSQVMLPGRNGQPEPTTLRDYHAKRLLGK